MTSLKPLLLITLLISISYVQSHGDGYDCDHDNVEQNPEFHDLEEDTSAFEEGRNLASTSYPNTRIYPYFNFLDSTASSSYASYIKNDLVLPMIDYFQAALKIRTPVVGNLKLSKSVTKMCERNVPSLLTTTGVTADQFIYFDTQQYSSSFTATSKYCYLASGTKRPFVTRVLIYRERMPEAKGNILVTEKHMYVLMHEMLHMLGISTHLFRYYLDTNGRTRSGHIKSVQIAGQTRTVIDVPPLTQKLRNFYGCPTLQGAIMEDDGGDGTASSHFERKFFVYEAMSSGSIHGRRVTEVSLSMLEGSGWYIPDYSYAEPFFFGQGQGCSFISGTCSSTKSSFDEYCTGSGRGCAPHGRGGGKCSSDSLSESCRYHYPDEDYDCENPDAGDYATLPSLQTFGRGKGSKCFTGTLSSSGSTSTKSYCFKYTCNGSGSSTTLSLNIGSKTYTCNKEGTMTVAGYKGVINCPDPMTFCNTVGKKYCPRNCMGRGTCVNNVCQCKSGYKGVDCASRA